MRSRTTVTLTAALLAGTLTPLALSSPATAAPAKYADDFNGDGYRDYAYSGSVTDAGSDGSGTVGIIYGTATGPNGRKQNITQNSPGIPGTNEWDDGFGHAMAGADFNRDGYADLAVAAYGEDVGARSEEGAIVIIWGSASGLSGATSVPNKAPQKWGQFGLDLAVGDFNGDGRPDLAALNNKTAYVYLGSFTKSGFSGTVTKLANDHMSAEHLAVGKVTKDSATDLVVVGAVDGSEHTVTGAWFVRGGRTLTRGTTLKLGSGEDTSWQVDTRIADFNKDGYGDIALGHPNANGKGAVLVWRGGSTGPGGVTRISQDTSGVAGGAEVGDRFGARISVGDVNHDGYPDLAVASPGEDLGGHTDAGAIHILRGSASGLTGSKSQYFDRSSAGVPGGLEANASFGERLRLRDSNRDGYADLFADYLRLRGTSSGITTSGIQEAASSDFMQ
ncbi:FG-GAP-like repeat-containing protein [Streptomyces yaanensis]|uniref:FG-GAP-like repeat-containing protein n=1 Tax=Streptomyces yaanensis TaxID=1142239 RepID=A0ABV7SG05_9ACTN|nr:FG-GAP-like repeat-containing protein [Streptomyces sp. CGMCC 4.7035]WNB97492.1 FG-GAP-like repeat-containing protein [Streptomyces sp. CGMCC 4.7035]